MQGIQNIRKMLGNDRKLKEMVEKLGKSFNNDEKRVNFAFEKMALFSEKMDRSRIPALAQRSFFAKYLTLYMDKAGTTDLSTVSGITENGLKRIEELADYQSAGLETVKEVGVLKLNGGLGTTMGCEGAKSAIEVFPGLTFLDVIGRQVSHFRSVWAESMPFLLMNSFNTRLDSDRILGDRISHIAFDQHRFPRIESSSLAPFSSGNDVLDWNPGGHGDLLASLETSGRLDELIASGIEFLFVSNADNLGAVLDARILGYMKAAKLDFVMEVTPKTPSDIKGGALVSVAEKLSLLEIAQVADDQVEAFQDLAAFPLFNTNNLWLRISAIKAFLQSDNAHLPPIINPKSVNGTKVLQLESALGSALSAFPKTAAVCVQRDRFLPVKSTADLLLLRSDVFEVDRAGFLKNCVKGQFPVVSLGTAFSTVRELDDRVVEVPSLKDCTGLSLMGDVRIGKGVTFKGNVSFDVPPGQHLLLEQEEVNGD